jgi:hypothetical protein
VSSGCKLLNARWDSHRVAFCFSWLLVADEWLCGLWSDLGASEGYVDCQALSRTTAPTFDQVNGIILVRLPGVLIRDSISQHSFHQSYNGNSIDIHSTIQCTQGVLRSEANLPHDHLSFRKHPEKQDGEACGAALSTKPSRPSVV